LYSIDGPPTQDLGMDAHSLFKEEKDMSFSTIVLAYLGPETMLPMTSVVAGVVGILLMFGRASMRWTSGTVRGLAVLARPRPKPPVRLRRIGTGPVGRIGSPANSRERVRA
jgi:hypothetical protein